MCQPPGAPPDSAAEEEGGVLTTHSQTMCVISGVWGMFKAPGLPTVPCHPWKGAHWDIYEYVCVNVCLCVWLNMSILMCIVLECICVSVHMFEFVSECVCMWWVCVWICVCLSVFLNACMWVCVFKYECAPPGPCHVLGVLSHVHVYHFNLGSITSITLGICMYVTCSSCVSRCLVLVFIFPL